MPTQTDEPGCCLWARSHLPKPENTEEQAACWAGWLSVICCCRGLNSAGQHGGYALFLLIFLWAVWVACLIWGMLQLLPGAVSGTSAGAAGTSGVQQPHLSYWNMVTSTAQPCKVTSKLHVWLLWVVLVFSHPGICAPHFVLSCFPEHRQMWLLVMLSLRGVVVSLKASALWNKSSLQSNFLRALSPSPHQFISQYLFWLVYEKAIGSVRTNFSWWS